MYEGDFFLTWDKTDDELEAVFTVADALRYMRENNISTKIFESGLGISLFRDNSTRTRFSFASACNLLGLEVQDLDEGKSQIAHGETVRETANMISFMADVIGIRDDMYIGKGNAYMHEVVPTSVHAGPTRTACWSSSPTLVNLQCDIDHPTQCMADMLLPHPRVRRRGEPQGQEGRHDLGLLPLLRQAPLRAPGRHRPDDPLRHGRGPGPPRGLRGHARGRGASPRANAAENGGTFKQDQHHGRGLRGRRHRLSPSPGLPTPPWRSAPTSTPRATTPASRPWRRSCLPRTPQHKDWCSTDRAHGQDRQGPGRPSSCTALPADISGVSCEHGEVDGRRL